MYVYIYISLSIKNQPNPQKSWVDLAPLSATRHHFFEVLHGFLFRGGFHLNLLLSVVLDARPQGRF